MNALLKFSLVAVLGLCLMGCSKTCEKTAQSQPAGGTCCNPSYLDKVPSGPVEHHVHGPNCGCAHEAEHHAESQPASAPATAPADSAAISPAAAKQAEASLKRGTTFLMSQFQPGVGWALGGKRKMFPSAATALALWTLVQNPEFTMETPQIKEGYKILLSYQQPDGGIYNPKEGKANYCTSLAVCALAAAKSEQFKPAIAKAVKYLRGIQITEGSTIPDPQKTGETITKDHPYLGGVSYGGHSRPDLSNVGYWVEAMHAAGVSSDDPAMKNAVAFITRCQNRSESNDLAWAKTGPNDGGMIYAPAQRNASRVESKADPNTKTMSAPVSYGSISYVGMKSMLYAGLSDSDPRVRALIAWLGENWNLNKNPGMPPARDQQSLMFYYLAMARALEAYGKDTIKHDGQKINWRDALTEAIVKRQKANGSWINAQDRWMEGDPVLVTSYELLALQAILAK